MEVYETPARALRDLFEIVRRRFATLYQTPQESVTVAYRFRKGCFEVSLSAVEVGSAITPFSATGFGTSEWEAGVRLVRDLSEKLAIDKDRHGFLNPTGVADLQQALAAISKHPETQGHKVMPEQAQAPIPMLLWCPECGTRHIDTGEFEDKVHHTHACQSCGMVWRPAIVPTRGVEFLPGFKNG